MTFRLNQNSFSRRRTSGHIGYNVVGSSGPSVELPWKNTGAGGSFTFYGNTDSYIRYNNNAQFNFGTNDFTVEWWQYGTTENSYPRPWAFGPWPDTEFGVSFEGNFILWVYGASYPFPLNKPIIEKSNHFAIVRSNSTFYVYQNGVEIGSQYIDIPLNLTYDLTIGYEGGTYNSQCFAGTLTNFNIVNYAKYTQTFTPTNKALTLDWLTNVILLPFESQQEWANPAGNYVGEVNTGSNIDWYSTSPFKFARDPYPVQPLIVTGGVSSEDPNYYYRTFLSSGTLTTNKNIDGAEFVIIGGGGNQSNGNNNRGGGGGGAGGWANFSGLLPKGSHNVVVGAGGGNSTYIDTYQSTYEALGGGYGQTWYFDSAGNGGCGGGGDWNSPGGLAILTTSYGHDGGSGYRYYGTVTGGGGGGLTVKGDNYDQYKVVDGVWYAGSGGDGVQLSSWATATGTGVNGYYGGGGGGGGWDTNVGIDGLGGGGGANTGSGGRTRYHGPGSGIVMVRWPK